MHARRRVLLPHAAVAGALAAGLGLAVGLAPVRAQDTKEKDDGRLENDPRLRLELEPTGPAQDLARARKLLESGRAEDGVALLDRIARDPHSREGLVARDEASRTKKVYERTLASFDRKVREQLLALDAPGRAAFQALHQDEARRFLDAGQASDELGSLREVVVRWPATLEAGPAALLLGERELEHGLGDAAAHHLALATGELSAGLAPAELARARALLPAALALAGRTGEAEQALERVPEAERAPAAAALELAKREAAAGELPLTGHALGETAWTHETLDYYEDPRHPPVPLSEPVLDATRLYVHDASHCLAVSLETGSLEWQTALSAGEDAYRRPAGPCRLALGTTVVACSLPAGSLVILDREDGHVVQRLSPADLERTAGLEDHDFALSPSLAVSGDTVVLAITSHHTEDELLLVGLDARSGTLRFRTPVLAENADGEAPAPELAAGPDAVYLASGRGVVAALDAVTGSVLWLRRYASFRDARAGDPRLGRRRFWPGAPQPPQEEGQEKPRPPSPAQFVGLLHGLVVAAPADARRVVAYAPLTGEEVWSQGTDVPSGPAARGQPPVPWTVLGPCRTGVLVLTEDGTIKLLERRERTVKQIPGAKLVGRPAVSGDALLLPLEGGLDRVDLGTGNIELLDDAWGRCGHAAHVTVAPGRILAVTPRWVVAFGGAAGGPVPAPFPSAALACRALGDPRWAVREAAQAQLLGLGNAARDELSAASGARDPEKRTRARFILDELARADRLAAWTPRVQPAWLEKDKDLLLKLTHRNPEVRLETLRALADLGDGVVPLLKDLLADADARVAANAAMALLERRDRTGIDLVHKALASEKVEDRAVAAQCLQRRGSPEDLEFVVAAARDPEPEVRAAAVVAALALGKEKAIPLAIALLDDKDAGVRSKLADELLSREIPPPPRDREVLDVLAPVFRKLVHDSQRGIRERVIGRGLTERPREPAKPEGPPRPGPRGGVPGAGPPGLAPGMGQGSTELPPGWGYVPRSHPAVFEALGEVLADTDPTVRDFANFVLLNAKEEDLHMIPRSAVEKALGQAGQDDLSRLHFVQIAESMVLRGEPFGAEPIARAILEVKNPGLLRRSIELLEKARRLAPLGPGDLAAVASLTLPANEARIRTVGWETLVNARGDGRGRLLMAGLEDPDENLRTFVREQLAQQADQDVLGELLRREVLAPRPEDQAAAGAVLDARAQDHPEALAPALILGLSAPEASVRAAAWRRVRALARREADLGLFEPAAPEKERAPAVERAARWWWARSGHERAPEALLEGLKAEASAQRWRTAKRLGELAAPELRVLATDAIRDGLARALEGEQDDYVQRQIVASLGGILGKDLGWKDGQGTQEKAQVLKRAREWRSLK